MMKEAVEFMEQMQTPFYAWFAGALVMVIDDPDDVHTVLTSKSCMEKALVYKFFNMGASLFTAPGAFTVLMSNKKLLVNGKFSYFFSSKSLETPSQNSEYNFQFENSSVICSDFL